MREGGRGTAGRFTFVLCRGYCLGNPISVAFAPLLYFSGQKYNNGAGNDTRV